LAGLSTTSKNLFLFSALADPRRALEQPLTGMGESLRISWHELFKRTEFRLAAIVWLFGYILVEVTAIAQGRSSPGEMFLANVPLLLSGTCLSIALGLLLDRLRNARAYQQIAVMAAAGLVAGVVQTAADDLWLRAVSLTVMPQWQDWAVPYQPVRLFMILILYLWTIYLTLALIWATRTTDHARLNEARAAAFEAAASRAEAAALRLQLNPHFLFNTLNGIASLVVRNRQDEAEEMIGRLAEFLRASLASNPTELVTLEQELGTIAAYLDIEKTRFGARLKVNIGVPPALMACPVPNFILQPLVENAIKHAVRQSTPLVIDITARTGADETILSVINRSLRPGASEPVEGAAAQASDRKGIGLENTRRRLATQYGGDAWLECRPLVDGFRAEIGIPMRAEAAAA
jgi:hypothetical protein